MKDDSSFQVGFKLPASISAMTGFFFTLAASGVCWIFHWPFLWALVGGGAVTFVVWMNLYNRMLYVIEVVLKQDINGDGVIGTQLPRLPQPAIRVEVDKKEDQHLIEGEFINLPAEPEQIAMLEEGLRRGYSFSVQAWSGPGKPFTRSQFESLRNELLARHLIIPLSDKSARAGYALTPIGRRVLAKVAQSTTPPPHSTMYTPK